MTNKTGSILQRKINFRQNRHIPIEKPMNWVIGIILSGILLAGCMKDDQWTREHQAAINLPSGVFVVNEGNFMYGNASLSFYNPATKTIDNDLFSKVNALPLGDVAQSMVIRNQRGFIVMNNSGKVYVIDVNSGKYIGKITGLVSPRYLHFVNDQKGYITDLYGARITIFDPSTLQITSSIATPGHASTEQMVQLNNRVFVSCWSYDSSILIIDTTNDQVVGEIKTGVQPSGLVLDKNQKIWTLCDGGWSREGGTPREPKLQCINPGTGLVEKTIILGADAKPSRLAINGTKDTLLFINNGVWKLPVETNTPLPIRSLSSDRHLYYSLTVDPKNSDLYISDAIDYQQRGIVYRYTAQGVAIDSFKVGIIPGSFSFK